MRIISKQFHRYGARSNNVGIRIVTTAGYQVTIDMTLEVWERAGEAKVQQLSDKYDHLMEKLK